MFMQPDVESAEALDRQLTESDYLDALEPGELGWSRKIREAIGLPSAALAKRMNISQPAVTQFEQGEVAGTITLQRLEALANALDCEFVYGFIPRRPFAETARSRQHVQETARDAKRKIPRAT